jgi:hypothetical protein
MQGTYNSCPEARSTHLLTDADGALSECRLSRLPRIRMCLFDADRVATQPPQSVIDGEVARISTSDGSVGYVVFARASVTCSSRSIG